MSGIGHRVLPGVSILPGGAAFLTDEKVLVVADMHLGAEAALEYEGLSIPRVQTRKIEEYMVGIIEMVHPSKVIVAGDLKHNFSRNLTQEWQDVERFIRVLRGKALLQVVRGNHDNYLNIILREHGIPFRNEVNVSGVRLLHGHKGELRNKTTIIGHIHPSIRLRDDVGASLKDQCFLLDRDRRVLVLPALSLVAYGTDVVSHPSSDGMSPLLSDEGLSGFVPIVFSKKGEPLEFPTVGELRRLHGR